MFTFWLCGMLWHNNTLWYMLLSNTMELLDVHWHIQDAMMQSDTIIYIYDTLLHHLYLYLTDIYSDLISHFDTLLDLIKFRHFDTRWHNITFQQDSWHFCDLFEQIIMTMIHFDTHSTMILSKSAMHYYAPWNDRSL